jgi:hypothetical protein
MSKEQEEQSFRVTDKRGFTEDGEPTSTEATEKAEDTKSEDAKAQGTKAEDTKASEQFSTSESGSVGGEAPPKPTIDFPSYILSYYTQGLVLLGEVPNPYTNKKEEDVDAARHTIDILSMLQEKTKGNLSQAEKELIETVLYELRMRYMAKTKRIKL